MPRSGKILVADDEATFLEATVDLLREEGFECDGAPDAFHAESLLRQKDYDLLIADIRMPGNLELELLKGLKSTTGGLPVILVTGYPSLDTAMLSTRLSVVGYMLKPVNFDDLLEVAQEAIAHYRSLRTFYDPQQGAEKPLSALPGAEPGSHYGQARVAETLTGRETAPEFQIPKPEGMRTRPEHVFEELMAKSEVMMNVVALIKKAAPTASNVLIIGETGTGKELIARAIHHLSGRGEPNFVPVDCSAIPANLLESELFGYEKGAFTGATARKPGLLEFAHGGTLFLDEISELDANLQVKLLRVLQERKFRRVGGKELIDVDLRVVAAMNRNPKKALAEGRLRRDLYYRLNVIPIRVPPLRRRREDIPLLVGHFLQLAADRYHFAPKTLAPRALALLQEYHWPGNVRQLKNVIERLVSLTTGPVIEEHDLMLSFRANPKPGESLLDRPFNEARQIKLQAFEKTYLQELMKISNHDVAKAAQIAGLSARTIYRMLQRHGKL